MHPVLRGQTSFQKVYHGFGTQAMLTDAVPLSGGDLILSISGAGGASVAAGTCSGEFSWHRLISAAGATTSNTRTALLPGGDIIVAYTLGDPALNSQDVIICRIGQDGTVAWAKQFGGALNEALGEMMITSSGAIVLTGETFSYGADAVSGSKSDIFFLRVDSNGGYLSSHVYGIAGLSESASLIHEAADGSFMIAGRSMSGSLSKLFIMKLLPDFSAEYFSVVGQDNHLNTVSGWHFGDSGQVFIAGGSTENGTDISSPVTPVVWQIDTASGTPLSAWFYSANDGGNGQAVSIEPVQNNKLLISILTEGYTAYTTGTDPHKIGFLRLETDGTPLSGRLVTTGGSVGGNLAVMNDGTCMLFGNCAQYSGSSEPVAFKLNSFFTSGCNENDIVGMTTFSTAWTPEQTFMTPASGTASNPVDISMNADPGDLPVTETLCSDPGNLEADFLGWGGCLGTNLPFEDISEGNITSWSWDFGDGTIVPFQHPAHMYADTGSYTITLTISDGCSMVSDSMVVVIEDAPVADAGPDQTIRPEESVVLGIPADNPVWEYQWSPGGSLDDNQIPQPVASPTVSTTYVLTVTSPNGCSVMDMVTVYVDMTPLIPDQTGQLYVPNIFSPNDDGENDALYVYGGPFTNFNLVIFNRLGERVFSSTNQEVGWDGRFRGNPAPIGAYYYSLTLTDKDMQTVSTGGNITLTR